MENFDFIDFKNFTDINPMALKDFYKGVHAEMIPDNMVKSVSYFTPRMSRLKMWPKVVNFGIQAFIKTWLIDNFNRNFFSRSEDEVVADYQRIMDNTLGTDICDYDKVRKLHRLGYLPIEIISLPEGVEVPMHVPMFGITNTHPDFAWLGQALESLISSELWYPMVTATVGHTYRKVVNKYYDLTCDDNTPRRKALGNFDFRGDKGVEASLLAASGWLMSFVNTATVPAIPYLENTYNCNCEEEEVGFGAISTEHFVMCSNCAYDTMMNPDYEYADIDPHREMIGLRRLLKKYHNKSFSCVCDSYDYDRVVDVFLPILKDEILAHNGCFLVRGDSGDCVKVVTDTVFRLWDTFGGTVNSKGYKVLDPHVKAIYGDSITIQRAEQIYQILMENGFAASNVALGVGSLSMQGIFDENGNLGPFTRDTFSMAIKAVYGEFQMPNGTIIKLPVYKDPKSDKGAGNGFKKSQKGCCKVFEKDGELTYIDELTYETSMEGNLLKPIFRNGKMLSEVTLNEVRQTLNDGKF